VATAPENIHALVKNTTVTILWQSSEAVESLFLTAVARGLLTMTYSKNCKFFAIKHAKE
jgi:Na+/phosphate symporter